MASVGTSAEEALVTQCVTCQRPASFGGRGWLQIPGTEQFSGWAGKINPGWLYPAVTLAVPIPPQELELVEDVWRGEAQDLLSQIAQLQEENKQLMTNLNHKDVGFSEEEFQKQEGEARHPSSPGDHSEATASILLLLAPVGMWIHILTLPGRNHFGGPVHVNSARRHGFPLSCMSAWSSSLMLM